jgi:hypothetical protein
MREPRIIGRWTVVALVAAGILVIGGSFLPWGMCTSEPCGGGLLHIWYQTGTDLGTGVLTAALELVLVVLGAVALRVALPPALPLGISAAVLVVVVAHLLRQAVAPPDDMDSTSGGLYFVVIGAVIGMLASLRLARAPKAPPRSAEGDGRSVG